MFWVFKIIGFGLMVDVKDDTPYDLVRCFFESLRGRLDRGILIRLMVMGMRF